MNYKTKHYNITHIETSNDSYLVSKYVFYAEFTRRTPPLDTVHYYCLINNHANKLLPLDKSEKWNFINAKNFYTPPRVLGLFSKLFSWTTEKLIIFIVLTSHRKTMNHHACSMS